MLKKVENAKIISVNILGSSKVNMEQVFNRTVYNVCTEKSQWNFFIFCYESL